MTKTLREALPGRMAWLVSMLINPLILPPLLLAWAARRAGAGAEEIWVIFGLGLAFYFLLPLGYLVAMVRRGEARTIEVRDRERRAAPLIVGLMLTLLSIPVLWWFTDMARLPVVPITTCLAINTAIALAVTERFKISLHTSGVAGFASILTVLSWVMSGPALPIRAIALLLLMVPLVMWARIRSRAHTRREAWWGAVFGLIVPPLELLALDAAGWLQ